GQPFEARTSIELHRVPEIVAGQYRMPLGAVAVQAPRELCDRYRADNTAVAIVLDCSGSMNARKPGETKRRFDKALDALEGVLKRLPAGVTVSLRVFGLEAETVGNPGRVKVERLWNNIRWDHNDTESYMRQLRPLKPTFGTPLVRALEETPT